ncbi:YciI family protein [Ancylobacter terrae]|uniref:YciI family protein n=1 Tax=Ancylobacter sp. sgz301288 TaxID=3342077 RepID=UPI00385ABD95
MPYMVIAEDAADTADLRAKVRPAHVAYLEAHLDTLIGAGAKLADDGVTALGSLYLIDTDDRAVAESFVANDPFMKEGVFAGFTATRWRKAILDGRSFIPKG